MGVTIQLNDFHAGKFLAQLVVILLLKLRLMYLHTPRPKAN